MMHLPSAEWAALQNRDYLPLKHRVTARIEAALLEAGTELEAVLTQPQAGFLPRLVRETPGRLSRGEAYLGQAYRVFDLPRVFINGHIFLFRCLFLWGHHLSFHLILSGDFAVRMGPRLLARRKQLSPDWLLATHADPWVWERENEHWHSVPSLTDAELRVLSHTVAYCKISRFYSLARLPDLPKLAAENWGIWQEELAIIAEEGPLALQELLDGLAPGG